MFEAEVEAEAKILASRRLWPRALNITGSMWSESVPLRADAADADAYCFQVSLYLFTTSAEPTTVK